MEDDAVAFRDVRFAWPRANGFVLEIPKFRLGKGESVLLLGPSGSGKSTFLSLLCGIVLPQSGTIEVMGQDMSALGSSARDKFRSDHFGIIFQMFNLLPYGSVADNVLLPLHFAKERRARTAANGSLEAEAERLLLRLGIDAETMARASTSDLSVGQQQRVAAARALIGAPEIIVADEPTSALDRNRQADFLSLLFEETARSGAALLMVSHDETLGDRFDRVVPLGEIAAPKKEIAAS